MKRKFIFAVILMGFSGLVAQIVLLRELMIAFHGNELSIGVVLANWLLLESAGAYFLGKKISGTKRKMGSFILVTLLFSIFFLAAIYAVRIFNQFLTVIPGEGLGIMPMFYVSFLILLPVSLLHGALFTSSCKLYFLYASSGSPETSGDKLSAFSIARVYIYETVGTLAGGLVLTYLFIPYLHAVKIAVVIALFNLGACWLLIKPFWQRQLSMKVRAAGISLFGLLLLTIYLLAGQGADRIHLFSVEQQWENHELVHYQNSNYGNIVVVEREDEYTFFSDGLPVVTTPNPDLVYVEEFVHFPMLTHPAPKDVLVLSGGAGGVINEILKHDVHRIDYAEVDPMIPEVIKKHPTPLTEREFGDPRVNVQYLDGRFFLQRTPREYDVILSGFTDPSTLQTNRFFTREFFSLAENKLTSNGIIVIGLPGSLTYLSPELADLNAVVLNTLESVFPYVRVVPGDGINFFLASRSPKVTDTGHAEMIERVGTRKLDLNLITPGYLEYRLHERWLDWFMDSIGKSRDENKKRVNEVGVKENRVKDVRVDEVRIDYERVDKVSVKENRGDDVRVDEIRFNEARVKENRGDEVRIDEVWKENKDKFDEARVNEMGVKENRVKDVRAEDERVNGERINGGRINGGRINEDFKPLGVFYSLVYWNEKFSPDFNRIFRQSEKINLFSLAGIFLVFFLMFLFISSRIKSSLKPALTLCMISTGFAGMLFDLILIFAFQVLYGYIFYWLGLLVTAFMAGVMVGGLWMTAWLKKVESALSAIIKIELVLIVFAFLLPWIFLKAGPLLVYPWFDFILRIVFLMLSFISGVLIGAEFPLANKEYLNVSPNLSGSAGLLYSSDLWGGWLGGILGGVVLLPVLGLIQTSLVIVMFKISSLLLLVIASRR